MNRGRRGREQGPKSGGLGGRLDPVNGGNKADGRTLRRVLKSAHGYQERRGQRGIRSASRSLMEEKWKQQKRKGKEEEVTGLSAKSCG